MFINPAKAVIRRIPMSVNYADHIKQLMSSNPTITHAAVVTMSGQVLFQTKNWDVTNEIKKLISDWQAKAPFIIVNNIRYSILQCTPERLISTNVGKKGHLVGATTPEGHLLLTHTIPDGNYQVSYMDTARAADQMKPGGIAPKGNSKTLAKADMSLESTKIKIPFTKKEDEKSSKSTNKTSKEDKQASSKKELRKEHESQAKKMGKSTSTGAGSSLVESLLNAKREKSPAESLPLANIPPALYQEIKNFLTWIYDPVGLAAYIDYAIWQNDQVKIAQLAALYRKIGKIFNFIT